jgi:hypothetical protein
LYDVAFHGEERGLLRKKELLWKKMNLNNLKLR